MSLLQKVREWWIATPEDIEAMKPPPRPATILSDDPLDAFDDETS